MEENKYSRIAASNTESAHQIALFAWAADNTDKFPMLSLMFHIPNGGLRSKATASRMKLEGVRKGVPDIFLPFPTKSYHGLWIEMKAPNQRPAGQVWHPQDNTGASSGLSAEQKNFAKDLHTLNYKWVVCFSWENAVEEIVNYLFV